jgi:hypothetical protein
VTIRRKKGAGFPIAPSERRKAIECIVAAAGKEPDSRDQLAADIDAASYAFAMFDAVHRMKPVQKRQIQRVVKAIKRLETLVNKQPQVKALIGDSLNFKDALASLDQPDSRMRFMVERLAHSGRQTTPIEYLTGLLLPLIFEDRFDLPSKWTRRKGDPDAPVIAFIEATTEQMGVKCSRETIGSALSRLKQQRFDLDKNRKK